MRPVSTPDPLIRMHRFASLAALLAATLSLTACVFAPESDRRASPDDLSRMGAQAVATCGAGNVKEVSAKSFSCK